MNMAGVILNIYLFTKFFLYKLGTIHDVTTLEYQQFYDYVLISITISIIREILIRFSEIMRHLIFLLYN